MRVDYYGEIEDASVDPRLSTRFELTPRGMRKIGANALGDLYEEAAGSDPDVLAAFYAGVFGWRFNRWDGPMEFWSIVTGSQDEPGIDGGLVRRRGHDQQVLAVAGRRLLLTHAHYPDRAQELESRKDDRWAPKKKKGRSDPQASNTTKTRGRDRRTKTCGGVDVEGHTKDELMQLWVRAEVARGRMVIPANVLCCPGESWGSQARSG